MKLNSRRKPYLGNFLNHGTYKWIECTLSQACRENDVNKVFDAKIIIIYYTS